MTVAGAAASDFTKNNNGITASVGDVDVELMFYTPSTLRVIKNPASGRADEKSLSVIANPKDVRFSAKRNGKNIVLKSDSLTAALNTETGAVTFMSADGKTLLKEGGNASFTPVDDAGEQSFRVRQNFILDKNEPIYGFGNLETGKLSQRGLHRTLMPGNIEDGIPVFVSVKGYGVYWDNYSPTTFSDNDGSASFESEVGRDVDYYFMFGGTADRIIAEMRTLSGAVPMFPLWTYGFWQSRERYKTQDEIVEW